MKNECALQHAYCECRRSKWVSEWVRNKTRQYLPKNYVRLICWALWDTMKWQICKLLSVSVHFFLLIHFWDAPALFSFFFLVVARRFQFIYVELTRAQMSLEHTQLIRSLPYSVLRLFGARRVEADSVRGAEGRSAALTLPAQFRMPNRWVIVMPAKLGKEELS